MHAVDAFKRPDAIMTGGARVAPVLRPRGIERAELAGERSAEPASNEPETERLRYGRDGACRGHPISAHISAYGGRSFRRGADERETDGRDEEFPDGEDPDDREGYRQRDGRVRRHVDGREREKGVRHRGDRAAGCHLPCRRRLGAALRLPNWATAP